MPQDKWCKTLMYHRMRLNENTNTLKGKGWAFGDELVNFPEQGLEWNIKLNKIIPNYEAIIGIWEVNEKFPATKMLHSEYWYYSGYGHLEYIYSFKYKRWYKCSADDEYTRYGRECRQNETLQMILDNDNRQLRFKISGDDYGKAYDIKPGIYKLIVYLGSFGDSLTLL